MAVITGTNFNDVPVATASDDTIYGLQGTDFIDGRGGNDTVVFFGVPSDYSIIRTNSAVIVTGNGVREVLINVERLLFQPGPGQQSIFVSSLPIQSSVLNIGPGFNGLAPAIKNSLGSSLELMGEALGTDDPAIDVFTGILGSSFTPLQLSTSQLAFQSSAGFVLIQGSNLHYTGSMSAKLDLELIDGVVTNVIIYSGGSYSNTTHQVTGGTVAATASFSATQIALAIGNETLTVKGAGIPTDYATWMSIVAGTYAGPAISFTEIGLAKAGQSAVQITLSATQLSVTVLDYRFTLSGSFTTALDSSILSGGQPNFMASGLTLTDLTTGAVMFSISGLTAPMNVWGNNGEFLGDFLSTIAAVNGSASPDGNKYIFPNLGYTTSSSGDDLKFVLDPSVVAANVIDGIELDANMFVGSVTGGAGPDWMVLSLGNHTFDGGAGVDNAVFSGNRAAYTITQTTKGTFTVTDADGTDTLTNVEFAHFKDQTVHLLPGTGATVDFTAAPATFMSGIRDFDGNDMTGRETFAKDSANNLVSSGVWDGVSGWSLAGTADLGGGGFQSRILFNNQIGRWASVAVQPDGKVYFDNHGWSGDTRIVGIYIDPLVQSGDVAAGGPHDSQRRFQNDLFIGNLKSVLHAADYDKDGGQEVYFSLTDGTAFLHAYMHADGNIRYANYQSESQVQDYLAANSFAGPTTWLAAAPPEKLAATWSDDAPPLMAAAAEPLGFRDLIAPDNSMLAGVSA